MDKDLEIALFNFAEAKIVAENNPDLMIKWGYDIFNICSRRMGKLSECKEKLESFKNHKNIPKELKRYWAAEENYHNNHCPCGLSSIRRTDHPECRRLSNEYFESLKDLIAFARQIDLDKEIAKNIEKYPENFSLSYRIKHKLHKMFPLIGCWRL